MEQVIEFPGARSDSFIIKTSRIDWLLKALHPKVDGGWRTEADVEAKEEEDEENGIVTLFSAGVTSKVVLEMNKPFGACETSF